MESQVYIVTIIVSILIATIIIVFTATIIRYHKRYVKLQKDRIFAEINIQENERRRIATDLHDSIGPLLSAIKLNINSIEVADKNDQHIIEKAGRSLDEIITSMRQISYNLLPNTLERKGLTEAVNEFIQYIKDKHDLKIQFRILQEINVAKEKQIHLFRIIQEIIHNAIKHSKAGSLQIGIGQQGNHVFLLAKDNGIGFDTDETKKTSGGFGLKSLESRTEILNGTMTIESGINKGVNYFIKVPV